MIQSGDQRSFQTTRWSVVRRAVGTDEATAPQALAALCEAYWYPLYAYVRRSGYNPHDAEDLTQGFFARLLEKNVPRCGRSGQRQVAQLSARLRRSTFWPTSATARRPRNAEPACSSASIPPWRRNAIAPNRRTIFHPTGCFRGVGR